MSELQDRIGTSFGAQGLMTTLGAELVQVTAGEVHIALWPRSELSQQHGFMHAGAITSVVDSACGYAALTMAPAGHEVMTIEFKVNFMRPAAAERFLAIGKVIKAGRSITVCQGQVLGEQDGQRRDIALMQATMTFMPIDG